MALRARCYGAFLILSLLLPVSVQQSESADFTIEVLVMHVEGNTTLPDPDPLNAFLAQNDSLFNPLFHSDPPLQLQICNSSIYKQPFNLYTIEHPGGCAKAPGMAKDAKQRKLLQAYERLCWI